MVTYRRINASEEINERYIGRMNFTQRANDHEFPYRSTHDVKQGRGVNLSTSGLGSGTGYGAGNR